MELELLYSASPSASRYCIINHTVLYEFNDFLSHHIVDLLFNLLLLLILLWFLFFCQSKGFESFPNKIPFVGWIVSVLTA